MNANRRGTWISSHLGIDPGELRQCPCLGVRKELRDGQDVGFRPPAGIRPVVEISIRIETRVVVVDPCDVGFVELLEDGALRKTKDGERDVVHSVSMGRARSYVGAALFHLTLAHVGYTTVDMMATCIPIRIGRTRNVAEPVVKQNIVLGHRTIDGYHVLGKGLDNIGSTGHVVRAMRDFLFYDEAEHAFCLFEDLGGT